MDSDRTIGRTNVRVSAAPATSTSSSASRGIAQQPPPPPPPPPSSSSSASSPPVSPPQTVTSPTGGGGGGGGTSLQSWPTGAGHYRLSERIGQGAFASVWRARIKGAAADNGTNNAGEGGETANAGAAVVECAIKIMDLEHVNINIGDIRLEVQTMRLSSHPNVLVCHTSFVRDTDLWLVTQLMSKGSSLHCLQSARANLMAKAAAEADDNATYDASFKYASDDAVLEGGLSAHAAIIPPESLVFESHITYILHETLLGLKYIHDNGQIHRDIKAGNLLLDGNADVRIADFGVSSWLVDGGSRREHTTTFVGTPCWMAPEVMEQVDGYAHKADIWSLGITALELCKGYAPYAKFAPMKVLLLTIQEDPPGLETYDDGDDVEMWSRSFRSMVRMCLQKDPARRPTCQELLAHRHFRPLATAEGRAERRERTRTGLCDVVEDVGGTSASSGDGGAPGSFETLPGAAPIQIVSTKKKDRPAGTSWILPGGSTVMASSIISSASGGGGGGAAMDFYDQFEQQTGGENFIREGLQAKIADDRQPSKNTEEGGEEEEDDMNDFFDEFEKATGGENFRRQA